MALEQLLANRVATMDFQCRDLELNTELMACLNDAQATEANREAKVHCKNAACALQQAHWDNVLELEHEARQPKSQIIKPSQKPLGQLCELVCLSPMGNSSTLYRSLLVMCP